MTVAHDVIVAEIAALAAETRFTVTASGYGVDLLCVDDITARADDTDANSIDSLRQDLYHRLTTDELPAIDRDEFAYRSVDVLRYLHRGTTNNELLAMAGEVTEILQQDDRVELATVQLGIATGVLRISAHITPADPAVKDFDLIVTVSDAGTELEAE